MLKPALMYKKELENKFTEIMYDDEYYLYMGYIHGHELPKIEPQDNAYQWAIVDKAKLIGWFAYRVQPETDSVYNFGLYSFDRGNPIIGIDVFNKMEELVRNFRRIEWRALSTNSVVKHYDKFCQKHGGNKVVLHEVGKAPDGSYWDDIIYEIVRAESEDKE